MSLLRRTAILVCFAGVCTASQLPPASSSGLVDSQSPPRFPNTSQISGSISTYGNQASNLKTATSSHSTTDLAALPVCVAHPCYIPGNFILPHAQTVAVNAPTTNETISSALKEECLLWDSSCTGNRTAAVNQFFKAGGTKDYLINESGWFNNGSSKYAKMRDWMRSPQCKSMLEDFGKKYENNNHFEETCCKLCGISASLVDVYYWSEPNIDTSCLSIVGNRSYPVNYGATTDGRAVYWGCVDGSKSTQWTASLSTFWANSLVGLKQYLVDPWSSQPCTEPPERSSTSLQATGAPVSLHARGHSLIIPSSVTKQNGSKVSTTVSGSFTFTSPSVYAHFSNLRVDDGCGSTMISSTMLTLSPGELSTLAGMWSLASQMKIPLTKQFNFADLPCPPQSVMKENWWKPRLGEPYRPLLAVPSQIQNMNSWFKLCTLGSFVGLDPPRTLQAAIAMAPVLTSSDPSASQVSLKSNLNPPLAVQNGAGGKEEHAPAPASTATVDQPKKTNPATLPPKQDNLKVVPPPGDPGTPPTSSAQAVHGSQEPRTTNPSKLPGPNQSDSGANGNANHGAGSSLQNDSRQKQDTAINNANSGKTGNSNLPLVLKQTTGNVLPNLDPSNMSPEQMSHLVDALATSGVNPPTTVQRPDGQNQVLYGGVPSSRASEQPNQGSSIAPVQLSVKPLHESATTPSIAGVPINGPLGVSTLSAPNTNPLGHLSFPNTPADPPTSSSPQGSGQPAPEQQKNPPGDTPTLVNVESPNPPPPVPLATTLSVASHAVVVGPSGVHIDGSKIEPHGGPVTVSGGVAINHGNGVVLGKQIYHLPSPKPAPATNVAGHSVVPVAYGAVVNGHTIAAGANPITISGVPIHVDSSNSIHVAGIPYRLPTVKPAMSTTLPNGAAAVMLPSAVSIHGTTLSVGASAALISGTAVSLDSSSNLIYEPTALALPSDTTPPPLNPEIGAGQTNRVSEHPIVPLTHDISSGAATTVTPDASPITISLGSSTTPVAGANSVPLAPPLALASTIPSGGDVISGNEIATIYPNSTMTSGAADTTMAVSSQVSSTITTESSSFSQGGYPTGGLGAGKPPGARSSSSSPATFSTTAGTQGAPPINPQTFTAEASHTKDGSRFPAQGAMIAMIVAMMGLV